MSHEDHTDSAPADDIGAKLRQAGGLLRYVQDNPLATIAGVFIIGAILARFAFLGDPKDS